MQSTHFSPFSPFSPVQKPAAQSLSQDQINFMWAAIEHDNYDKCKQVEGKLRSTFIRS